MHGKDKNTYVNNQIQTMQFVNKITQLHNFFYF
ncbi:hypothetical protein SDC9_54967 [bioreactor metagenome]|uniref:Uncharacterized protein n=1 Tax=bioreactor metagenome TaxID=1076179 RepID=A0A644X2X7_9ZZZZ